jgi:uncharacterized protein (DUF488 family)
MPMVERDVRPFGVGYQGRDLSEFVELLQHQGATLLVDVRLNPISRKRGFSKTALAQALSEADIAYEHMRELGNPKWNRAGFGGTPAELGTARGVYSTHLMGHDAQKCLDRVAEAARRHLVAVMCFEADQHRCHRDLVLSAISERFSYALPA